MADSRIRIDRLVIRVRGGSESHARGMVKGLASSLLRELSSGISQNTTTASFFDHVDAGTVQYNGAEQTGAAVAHSVSRQLSAERKD